MGDGVGSELVNVPVACLVGCNLTGEATDGLGNLLELQLLLDFADLALNEELIFRSISLGRRILHFLRSTLLTTDLFLLYWNSLLGDYINHVINVSILIYHKVFVANERLSKL